MLIIKKNDLTLNLPILIQIANYYY